MIGPVRTVLALTRAELAATARSPVSWIILALFLAVQGAAFAALLAARSRPDQLPPIGPVLEGYFAGSLLTHNLGLIAVAALASRALAEPRRTGTLDGLVALGVGDGALVIAAWLAASLTYALAWAPTLLYVAVVAGLAGAGALDPGPIVAGYVGVVVVGAAVLAVALAVTSVVTQPLLAVALAFVAAVVALLGAELAGAWLSAGAASTWSLRAQLAAAAGGAPRAAGLALAATMVGAGLLAASAGLAAGRRRRDVGATRLIAGALVLAIGVQVVLLAQAQRWSLDVTAAGQHTLRPASQRVLAALPATAGSIRLTVIRPVLAALGSAHDEIVRVVDRLVAASPALRRDVVDGTDPAVATLAAGAGLLGPDLGRGGGVVVRGGGGRQVVLDLLALVAIDADPGAPRLERLAVEAELVAAIAQVSDPRPLVACFSGGHGELGLVADPAVAELSPWIAHLREDGAVIRTLDALAGGVAPDCAVLLVMGPTTSLTPAEALATQDYLAGGGALVVAAAARPDRGVLPATGLEPVMAAAGLELTDAVAIEPDATDAALVAVADGYRDHPINAGMRGQRVTTWIAPRVVSVRAPATVLIETSAAGWGERGWSRGAVGRDPDDLPGPVALAAASEVVVRPGGPPARLVVLGSAESLSTAVTTAAAAGRRWATAAVRWAARRQRVAAADDAPAPVWLRVDPALRQRLAIGAGAGLPALALLVALVLGWRRRRQGEAGR
ncbi:MAG: Gldg family protein [Kofleriaceae bacterium]|nr:Gldg family protein [Kofleriaceae bacterium]